jgi:release factor glutamine methyltransferase
LEGEILLRHVLRLDRAGLYTRPEKELSAVQAKELEQVLQRRLHGEPSAYITGHKEFFGLDFRVNRDVLIPRPETELLVEKALALAARLKVATVADIGTGSGAVAVSLAVNLPGVTFYATDVSAAALEVARRNCRAHRVGRRVKLLRGDLLEPLPRPVDLIVANLPYVRAADLPGTLEREPRLALDGGRDGLNCLTILVGQSAKKLKTKGCLLLEVGRGQAAAVGALLNDKFPGVAVEIFRDLAGIERVVGICLT